MPELIPASPGTLEIFYSHPMIHEVHPVPLKPGAWIEIVPTYPAIAKIRVSAPSVWAEE